MFFLNNLGAKSLRTLRHVNHSWAVSCDSLKTILFISFLKLPIQIHKLVQNPSLVFIAGFC